GRLRATRDPLLSSEASSAARRYREPVARLGEGAFGEREHLRGLHQEDEDRADATLVPEAAVVYLVMPAPVPLRRPRLCETFEDALVHDLDGLALDHDVEPSLPLVATGRQDHVLVGSQVRGLLLAGAGGEVDGVIEPDSDEWRDMRSTVGPDGRDPEQLGLLERAACRFPVGRDCVLVAESRVELSHWLLHRRLLSTLFCGVLEDRSRDGLPVGSINAVAGSFQSQQPCAWDFLGQRLSVREREHWVGGAVD